jgi:hypothetical protein
MSRWFRFYDDAVNDPKVQRLEPKLFKAWVNLLCLASKNEGWFPSIDDVAFSLRVSEEEAGQMVDGLISSGLVDEIDGRCCPHNWHERQYKSDSSAERMKRHRDKKRDEAPVKTSDVTSDVTVTVQNRAETEQIQITEQKEETREDALLLEFDEFWNIWPHKVGKPAALKGFRGARKRSSLEEICNGVFSYIRDKPHDRPWLNPATFLNQNRWEDQPAQVANGKTVGFDQAYDRVLEKLNAGFGGPAPEERVRAGAGETDARLLAYRGRQ